MRAITHYEPLEEDQPGTPCEIFTYPWEEDLADLITDVKKARMEADIVAVSMHWGVHYFRALIAGYQVLVGRAAVDAGADIIFGHHPHMLKGVEVYKGKTIFYSLGNFAFDSHPKAVDTVWYSRRRKLYQGLFKVPEREEGSAFRFQPESRNSVIAKVEIRDKKILQVSVIPVLINSQAQPEPLSASTPNGTHVIQYLTDITREAQLNASFTIAGDEAVIGPSQ